MLLQGRLAMYLKTASIEHIVLLLGRGATSMYLKSASFEAIGLNCCNEWYNKEGQYDSRLAPTNCAIKSSQDGVICIWAICMFYNGIFLIVLCKFK